MIEDKRHPQKPTARDWAVFRYGLISESLRPLSDEIVAQTLARTAAHQHLLPDGSQRRFSAATLRSWRRAYQQGGLDALFPKTRSDKGGFRAIDEDTAEAIARFRVQHRQLSVKLFHQILHDDGVVGEQRICEATLRRFLKTRGLDKFHQGPGKPRSKYEMPYPNDLWVADFMHGPRVATKQGKRKVYLCAILDDHSRVVVGCRFALSEGVADLLHCFRSAIAGYGVPKRFYCDNGSAFSSRHLKEACSQIDCALMHSEPYDSPSRGKVERLFRTVRQRLLPLLEDKDLSSIEALQERLECWLRDDYHLKRHGGIGMKPLDRFLAGSEQTLIHRLNETEIDTAFLGRIVRSVRNDATVKVGNVFYELPPQYIKRRVELRFPVGKPDQLTLYEDDKPLQRIAPVDAVDNGRFKAKAIDVSCAQLKQQEPATEQKQGAS